MWTSWDIHKLPRVYTCPHRHLQIQILNPNISLQVILNQISYQQVNKISYQQVNKISYQQVSQIIKTNYQQRVI